ncbi:MAG TPA: hydrogenase small subunit [Gammaproteobacteria bacterium]|nr:hydrogenase small subunit [Gammaproteobacteria bacterium]
MAKSETVGEHLRRHGISRRAFLKFCAATASAMALPPGAGRAIAETLAKQQRPNVIWLSFQECTGCTESLTRSYAPTIEKLIFDVISLDYHETLMAASGEAAEAAREAIIKDNPGKYVVMIDGSVPVEGGYATIGGKSMLDICKHTVENAAAVVCVGTCSSFGGIPYANPNPTGAKSISMLMDEGRVPRKPLINVSGCPPIPVVITGVVVHYLSYGVPELDHVGRPKAFFGQTIHDRCYRRPFYDQGKFAKTFDDEGARNGWCLFELGCKGPTTYNACATTKWNDGTSFPIESGHGCLGCSEPNFWDKGSFYAPLATTESGGLYGLGAAAAAGVAVGVGAAVVSRNHQKKLQEGK